MIVTKDMIGHKFGEFAPTRTFYGHAADRKAKRAKVVMGKAQRERTLKENEARAVHGTSASARKSSTYSPG